MSPDLPLLPGRYGLFTISFLNNNEITEEEIKADFGKFGEVASVTKYRCMSGVERVFVKYRTREEAEAALSTSGGKYGYVTPAIERKDVGTGTPQGRQHEHHGENSQESHTNNIGAEQSERSKQDLPSWAKVPLLPRPPQFRQCQGPGTSPKHLVVTTIQQSAPAPASPSPALPNYGDMMKSGASKDFYRLVDDKGEDEALDRAAPDNGNESWESEASAGGSNPQNSARKIFDESRRSNPRVHFSFDTEQGKKPTNANTGPKRSKPFVDRPNQKNLGDVAGSQMRSQDSNSKGQQRGGVTEREKAIDTLKKHLSQAHGEAPANEQDGGKYCNTTPKNSPQDGPTGPKSSSSFRASRSRTRSPEPCTARPRSCLRNTELRNSNEPSPQTCAGRDRAYKERAVRSRSQGPAGLEEIIPSSRGFSHTNTTSQKRSPGEESVLGGDPGAVRKIVSGGANGLSGGPPPLAGEPRMSVRSEDIPDVTREVVVANLPPQATPATVGEMFSWLGPCRVSPVCVTGLRLQLPFCVVRFATVQQAVSALGLDDRVVDGFPLLVRRLSTLLERAQLL